MLSIPTLILGSKKACLLSQDGELSTYCLSDVSDKIKDHDIIVCHAPYTSQKANLKHHPKFDILELYAFIHPAKYTVPTINGIAKSLGLKPEASLEDQVILAHDIIAKLIQECPKGDESISNLINFMNHQGQGWAWSSLLLDHLGIPATNASSKQIALWEKLEEWEELAPPPPSSQKPVTAQQANDNLKLWLTSRQSASEDRPQQSEYTRLLSKTFQPTNSGQNNNIVLAEAGTGIGKTLGYLNPAWLWASQNDDTVWLSTYTKNLQRQLENETYGLIPGEIDGNDTVVIRKGRENYLCLLNLEERSRTAQFSTNSKDKVVMGIMLRWITATKDGDFSGSSFHGWLSSLFGYQNTTALSDRRGECIYGACDHYTRCFVEKSIRKSKHARLVISNHALTMIQAALAKPETDMPSRYIFDEGHHLFDAADSAYAANLTLNEVLDLRRWALGSETGRKTRGKGLRKRLEGLYEDDEKAEKSLDQLTRAILQLPDPQTRENEFFNAVNAQVKARVKSNQASFNLYGLECDIRPVENNVVSSAHIFQEQLNAARTPLKNLADFLQSKIDTELSFEEIDPKLISRLENLKDTILRRVETVLTPWITMLGQIENPAGEGFIDWFCLDRYEGKEIDTGMYRRWIDPMIPFAASFSSHMKGMAITSATLRDNQDNEEDEWDTAFEQTGSNHFGAHVEKFYAPSPFVYQKQSKIFIVNDVRKDNPDIVANAFASLMLASGGGALGIFTAIQRLKSSYPIIAEKLANHDINLLAQHVDDIDIGTLIDIFRDEKDTCLIGTDAVRDGVDVPGKALRMIVFERVPWPRPTILHKSRRQHFGGRNYDERMTRLKLKQAYGRLIRSKEDKGVFVMLDPMLPTRLQNAFPKDVEVIKTSLEDTIKHIKDFL